jgi:serine/threonine-protein phosphatase 2A activator
MYILNEAVKGKKNSDPVPSSPIIEKLTGMLDRYMRYIDETPPLEQPQRFGNKAYRMWSDLVKDSSEEVIRSLLPEELHGAVKELQPYLLQGFGNATRIDYGTGHEMKFVAFLCCLMKMKIIPQECAAAIVIHVITRYLDLMRKLQTVYRMEPAGSHGVWGLDDFQFLPFIWGAAQLIGQSALTPLSFVDETLAKLNSSDYLFMSCITYINTVKTGPFAEHSNALWGISSVAEWTKVNSGLIKMYKAEVCW